MWERFILVLSIFVLISCAGYTNEVTEETVRTEEQPSSEQVEETSAESNALSVDTFIGYITSWNNSNINKLLTHFMEYLVIRKDHHGVEYSKQVIVKPGGIVNGLHSRNTYVPGIFRVPEFLVDGTRLRNVETTEQPDVFELVLLDGIELNEHGKKRMFDIYAKCQFVTVNNEPVPRCFIYETLDLDRSIRSFEKLQVITEWDYYESDEQIYWLPVNLQVTIIAQKNGKPITLKETWKLSRIRAGYNNGLFEQLDIIPEGREMEDDGV